MNKKERQIIKNFVKAINELPKDKQEYVLGFAEGVATAVAQKSAADDAN